MRAGYAFWTWFLVVLRAGEAEQLIHRLLIGVGEGILVEVCRAHPTEVFDPFGLERLAAHQLGFVERGADPIAVVLVHLLAQLLADLAVGVEALAQLALERVLVALTRLDLAAGEL